MRNAFSLVELSIVLVILGLLVGGILAGQSLIHASELRAVTTELMRFQTSFAGFRDKYLAQPGDMTNAVSFWGTVTASGNGNGIVPEGAEGFRAWQHLTLSGFLEGTYTGVNGSPLNVYIGSNIPASRMTGVGYNIAGTASRPIQMYFGTGSTDTSGAPWAGGFTGEEMWNIDKKIDNGMPGNGRVVGINGYAMSLCLAATTPVEYRLDSAVAACTGYWQN